MGTYILVNIDSGNGLFPGGAKPLRDPMLINQWSRVALTWGKLHSKILKMFIFDMSLRITNSKLQPQLQSVNELIVSWQITRLAYMLVPHSDNEFLRIQLCQTKSGFQR